MTLLLAAIGATVTALLEVGLVPYLAVGDAHLHPVLVLGVIWTIAAGLDPGIVWAFVGGLALDALTGRPLGASSVALLLAVGGAFLVSRSLLRLRPLAPIIAVPVMSAAYSTVVLGLVSAVHAPVTASDAAAVLLPGVVYDAVLGLVVGPLAISFHDRRLAEERVDW